MGKVGRHQIEAGARTWDRAPGRDRRRETSAQGAGCSLGHGGPPAAEPAGRVEGDAVRELLLRSQGLEAVWRVPRILRLAGSAPGCSTRRSLRCRGPGVGAARAETGESIGASTHLPRLLPRRIG